MGFSPRDRNGKKIPGYSYSDRAAKQEKRVDNAGKANIKPIDPRGRQRKLLNPNFVSSTIKPSTTNNGQLGTGSDTSMLTTQAKSTVSNTPPPPGPDTPLYTTTRGRTLDREEQDLKRYLQQIQQRQKQWANDPSRRNGLAAYAKEVPTIQERLNKIAAERQRLANRTATPPAATTPPATTPPATTPPAETPPATTPPADDPNRFRGVEDFLAKDITQDPAYQQQVKLGTESLDKYLSAKGLSGSGAQVEAAQRLNNQAASDQTMRALGTASTNAQLFRDYAQSLVDNKRNIGNDAFDKLYKILGLAASQSPMNNAYNASSGIAGSYDSNGNSIGGQMGQNYQNQPTGGGGGGGGKVNPYVPPFSTGNIDAANAGSGNANNLNWLNMISQFLGNLGGQSKPAA